MKKYLLLFLISVHIILTPKESEQPKSKLIALSGYINGKAFWDTRQDVGTTEDQVVFFPKPRECSPTGDVNAQAHAQIIPFETRLRITVEEPLQERHFNCLGIVEMEFKGASKYVNLLNMRHAFGQLSWNNSTFVFGQTWHALDVEELIPNTVSFNQGRPFAVYNRSPQLRYTYHAPSVDCIFYAGSQVDFLSDGPIGRSSTYIRNALIPNLDFQLKGHIGDHIIGAGIDYQRIAPRIVSEQGYKVHETLSSLAGIGYLGLFWEKIVIKNTLLFGGNLSNYGIIGGYAIKADSINPITGEQKYTNTRTLTGWSDVTLFPFEYIETGFFIGAEKNYGSRHQIELEHESISGTPERTIFGLGNSLDTVFRISPRIRINIKQITFAGEIEYTRAAYGTVTKDALVTNTNAVHNIQFLFSTFLYF